MQFAPQLDELRGELRLGLGSLVKRVATVARADLSCCWHTCDEVVEAFVRGDPAEL